MDEVRYNELIERAQYYGNQANWDKCIEYYKRAFEIMVRVDDLLDLSIVYLQIDNSFLALQGIESVISILPEDFRGYFYKGIYYEHLNQDSEALKYYLKALELESNVSEIYFKIGRIYDDLSDNEEKIEDNNEIDKNITRAKEYYLKALAIDPNHYYANLNLGSIYERESNLDKALQYTLKSYETDKNEKMASYNLGVIYSKLGKHEEAIKCYLDEVTKKDFYPFAYYNLGIIYKDQYKDYFKAKEYYLKGLKYLQKDPSLWYNLACTHVLTNDFQNAYDCFYCAISLNPKILGYLEEDDEVKKFIESSYFERLKEKC